MQIQQQQANSRTQAQVDRIARLILATYEEARIAVNQTVQAFYAKNLVGRNTADWQDYVLKQDRLPRLKAEVDRLYLQAARKAGVLTQQASSLAMSNNYYQNQYVFDWFTPDLGVDLSFTLLPLELIELSVTGNIERWQAIEAAKRAAITRKFGPVVNFMPKDGQTLTALLLGHRRADVEKLNRTISSALFRGQGYQKTARDVSTIIGVTKEVTVKGVTKKVMTGAKANALRIVRTEGNRTLNAASFANSMQASGQGLDILRKYVAVLDNRTRGQSASMDGQTVKPGEPFTYPNGAKSNYPGDSGVPGYDINDRCAVVDVIPGMEPTIRRGRNPNTGENELFNWKDYPTWARDNGLTQNASGRWV